MENKIVLINRLEESKAKKLGNTWVGFGSIEIQTKENPMTVLSTLLTALEHTSNLIIEEHKNPPPCNCDTLKFAKILSKSCIQIHEDLHTTLAGEEFLK